MQLQPKYLSLSELLGKRLFRIPEYQRCYSWDRKQRNDLFEDIRSLSKKPEDSTHFMATMVVLNRDKRRVNTDQFQVSEIVDGQQRITTLIILMKAIAKALDPDEPTQLALKTEIESLLVKGDDVSLLLLQTNHDTSGYFTQYLRTGRSPEVGGAKTLSERLLARAFDECERFVEKWGDPLALATLVKNQLYFVLYEIADESTVYTVFEVLNSRGLDVAWLDRLKSILMGIAFETVPRGTGQNRPVVDT